MVMPDTVPPGVSEVAEERGLGRLRATYSAGRRPGVRWPGRIVVTLFFAGVFGPGIASVVTGVQDDLSILSIGVAVIMAPVFVAALLTLYLRRRRAENIELFLFEHGLVDYAKRSGAVDTWPWSSVTSFYVRVTVRSINGAHTRTEHVYSLGRGPAYEKPYYNITDRFVDAQRLGEAVTTDLNAIQLAAARAALAAGEWEHFGVFSVSPDGLRCRPDFWRWDEVERVELQAGRVSVYTVGARRPARSVEAATVSHLRAFMTLARERATTA